LIVLNRTPETLKTRIEAPPPDDDDLPREDKLPRSGFIRAAWQFFTHLSMSSLTRRIIFLNVAGLVVMMIGILYLSQFRAGLIDARIQSLMIQGQIIANAVAASGTVDPDGATIDPQRLLELQLGEIYDPSETGNPGLDFPINPVRIAPVLQQLVSPTNTRARIYERDGTFILDSLALYDVLRFDLPPPESLQPSYIERRLMTLRRWLTRGDLPTYRELGQANGKLYEEVAISLTGQKAHMVRINDRAEVIVSVAVPVTRFRAVRGALMLSTQGAEIDEMVTAERLAVLRVFLFAAGVMIVLSFLLAGTIAGPMRRLAESAEIVRRRIKTRVEIPDFTKRRDEIGHLSGTLRDMTNALYSRIEAIESFAADVAHELKNPLTSLRSAVETLPLAKTDESRGRLLAVIQHDVKRLDRLITDISDASRLEAEMQRQEANPVDLIKLLTAVTSVANEVPRDDGVKVTLNFEGGNAQAFIVPGHDSRLVQVVNNLIDNARSFSPPDGTVRLICRRQKGEIEIIVDDDGPGIAPDVLEKIFDRFYTDRPEHGFGQNSGLGLSISKQIVEAHAGRMWAENRLSVSTPDEPPTVLGARFVVRLPAK
jgi:two-component system, OmpR family, sensor histidine kinase ChvG